jgi:hypothetical protein
MTRNPQERRSDAQQRASNVRLLLVLLAIVAGFFVSFFVKTAIVH